jgi:hypothetical protein
MALAELPSTRRGCRSCWEREIATPDPGLPEVRDLFTENESASQRRR